MFPMRRPPFDPNLGQPHKLPPTPTQRQMQMQAAHRGRGPRGWQVGGAVAPTNLGPLPGSPGAQPGYISPYPSGGGPFESTYGIIPQIPSPRQMQMQAAHRGRGRGPGGWQTGGMVGRNMFNPRAAAVAAMRRNRPSPQGLSPSGRLLEEPRPWPVQTPPGGWNIGGAVDSTEALMAERDRLQQQLQTADEAMAQEIMAQIMEINKELEMAAAPGMAGGGVASLMGYQGGGAPRRTGYAPSSYTSPTDQYGRAWGFKRRHLGKSFDPRVQTKATQYALQNYWGRPPGGG